MESRRSKIFGQGPQATTAIFQHSQPGMMPPIPEPAVGSPCALPTHQDSLMPRIITPRGPLPFGPKSYPRTVNSQKMMPTSLMSSPKIFDEGIRFPRYREQVYGDDWTKSRRIPIAEEMGSSPHSKLRAFKTPSTPHVIYQKQWGAFDEKFSRPTDALWPLNSTLKLEAALKSERIATAPSWTDSRASFQRQSWAWLEV